MALETIFRKKKNETRFLCSRVLTIYVLEKNKNKYVYPNPANPTVTLKKWDPKRGEIAYVSMIFLLYEPRREKTGVLHMRKQRSRSASRRGNIFDYLPNSHKIIILLCTSHLYPRGNSGAFKFQFSKPC